MEKLPFAYDFDQIDILKQLVRTKKALGELNGITSMLPDADLLLQSVLLMEAKHSCEIEQIHTTWDALFKEISKVQQSLFAREVLHCAQGLCKGYSDMDPGNKNLLTFRGIEEIHAQVKPDTGGYRRIPGTVVMNARSGQPVFVPPQSAVEVREMMFNLETYLNLPEMQDTDPLIKMSVAHVQFESIHPFTDGNGRTGRILNLLYLVREHELTQPVMCLSRYLNQNRTEYYRLLRMAHESFDGMAAFVLFMLKGIEEGSRYTSHFLLRMRKSKDCAEAVLEENGFGKAHEFAALLFSRFYLINETICTRMGLSRNTAMKYLKKMKELGLVQEERIGKFTLYKNALVMDLMDE